MAKIGRNEKCPCGSGKKYKKCCLAKDREEAQQRREASAAGEKQPVVDDLPPYVITRMFEESEQFARMKQMDPVEASRFWTTSKVAALATAEIVSRLGELGVDASQGAFIPLTADTTSAWELSDVWRDELRGVRGGDLPRHDDDFLGLAACELWKRYSPERPSKEMLDDWMQEGYQLWMERRLQLACDRWQQVWEVIRERMTPQMRTCEDAEVVFHGTQSIFNWLQDFQLELANAAQRDKRYAFAGVSLCEEVLARFPDESELFTINFRADLGEALYLAGRPEDGERVLLQVIDDRPDHPAGYARLSDMLGFGRGPGDRPANRDRAIALLESALARPVEDAKGWGLDTRLEDLRKAGE